MDLSWETIKDFLVAFGLLKGMFVLFFFMAHFWIFKEYSGRLKDRQDEINRIAQDNREYRERFLALLDRHFGLEEKSAPPALTEASKTEAPSKKQLEKGGKVGGSKQQEKK